MGIFGNLFGKAEDVESIVEQEDVNPLVLNEQQMGILNKIIPGLSTLDDSNQHKLLEKLIPGFSDPESMYGRIKDKTQDMRMTHHSIAAYSAIYTKVNDDRKDVLKSVDKVRRFWLVDVILDQIAEDALAPDVSTGEILEAHSDDEAINKEIQYLDNKFDFDGLVSDIITDLLAYGEYYLKTEIEKAPLEDKDRSEGGLKAIHDTVNQTNVVAVTSAGKVQKYICGSREKITIAEPADFVKFSIGSKKIRVRLDNEFDFGSCKDDALKKELSELPRYVRVGKSVLYSAIPKIRELELLENMIPAAKLSKLSAGTLVGLPMPAGTEIDKLIAAAKKVEGIINRKVAVDMDKQELTIENIIAAAGRLKVVPLPGDKGRLEKLDYNSDEPDDLLNSVEDVRRVITTSVGVPYEIIFDSDGQNKGEVLKRYARYLRKLKSIQKAVSSGVKQIIMIHLSNKGIKYTKNDIDVNFRNKLVEIDNLDRLEFTDTTVNLLESQKRFIFELADKDESPFAAAIDLEKYLPILSEQLRTVGLDAVIKEADEIVVDPDAVDTDGDDNNLPPDQRGDAGDAGDET